MEPQLVLFLLLAFATLVLGVLWRVAATAGGRASRERNARAQAGEAEAERLLRRCGYRVVARQVRGSWTLSVDGQLHEAAVRADLLVSRHGRRFVAEVKTGAVAPDPLHPATRRQLLEYWLAFEPDGVLLVDMEARVVRVVGFPRGA